MTVTTADPRAAQSSERRRTLHARDADDALSLAGAAVGGLALIWILYERLLPFHGRVGFALSWYVAFLVLYAVLVSCGHPRVVTVDRVVTVLTYSAGLLVLGALVTVLGFTVVRGQEAVRHLQFFTEDLSVTAADAPLTRGGVLHGAVGTLQQITIAVLLTVPLGIACAVFLNEVKGRLARPVRTLVDAMSAVPSIVAGLFVFSMAILGLGMQRSGMAASLAISVMMLPIVIRTSEVVLRLVPGGLREASLALGASQWQTVRQVVLPTARSGLTTAIVLAMARGIGETAPVLLTAGFTKNFNANPLSDPQVSLPLVVYSLVRQPEPEAISRGFGAALVLLVLVLVLFTTARVLGNRAPKGMSR